MLLLKKLVTPFLIPPGLFVTMLVILGVWLIRRRNAPGGAAALFAAAVIWVLSTGVVDWALVRGLEDGLRIPGDPKGDVIVLLGGGVRKGSPDMNGAHGVPSEEMLARAIAALRLHRKIGAPIIISGGDVFGGGGPTEAEVVRRYLVELGMHPDKVIAEDKSRDTIENAQRTKAILDARGFKHPILVTSAIHMKRSVLSFRKAGVEVLPFPANFRTFEGEALYGIFDFLPQQNGVPAALHEYLGLAFYHIAY
jgi:uncharacterized SAM-binding protein YcdF (DUF218 family)